MKREDAIWLIKSGRRIMGPYSHIDVERLLRNKELQVIDEVCEPMRRWQMIRDHQAYTQLLEQLRGEDVAVDDVTTGADSQTSSLTEKINGPMTDDITEDISEFQSQLKEIVYENVNETQKIFNRSQLPGRFQSSASIDDRRIREEAEKGSRWMWGLTILVLLAVGGFWGVKKFHQEQGKIQKPNEAQAALVLFQEGDYSSSLEILKKIYNSDPSRKDIWFPLALMLVQIDGQTVEAKRLLQKVIDERTDNPASAWTGMALAQMTDNDEANAAVSLNKALSIDSRFLPAKSNQGTLALYKKEYPAAAKMLQDVYTGGLRRGEVLIQLMTAQIFNGKSGNGNENFAPLFKLVQNHLRSTVDYQQELRLSELFLQHLRGEINENELDHRVRRIIDVDPQQTSDFYHPILVSKPLADWSQLGEWCQQLVSMTKASPSGIGLEALCLMQQGQTLPAKAAIEKAIHQAPRDPLLQGLYAAILRKAGFASEASVALGRAIELDRRGEYLLPVLLQARFCLEREDLECANTYWLKVLELEPKLPAAKIGLAEVYWQQKSSQEANKLLQEVGAYASDYRPYLRLKRLMGNTFGP